MERFRGYRTIISNVILALAAGGLFITGAEGEALVAGIAAVVNIFLRLQTSTPVGKQE